MRLPQFGALYLRHLDAPLEPEKPGNSFYLHVKATDEDVQRYAPIISIPTRCRPEADVIHLEFHDYSNSASDDDPVDPMPSVQLQVGSDSVDPKSTWFKVSPAAVTLVQEVISALPLESRIKRQLGTLLSKLDNVVPANPLSGKAIELGPDAGIQVKGLGYSTLQRGDTTVHIRLKLAGEALKKYQPLTYKGTHEVVLRLPWVEADPAKHHFYGGWQHHASTTPTHVGLVKELLAELPLKPDERQKLQQNASLLLPEAKEG